MTVSVLYTCETFLRSCQIERIVQIAVVPHNGDLTVTGPALFSDRGAPIELTVKNAGDAAVSIGGREPFGRVFLDSSVGLDDSADD